MSNQTTIIMGKIYTGDKHNTFVEALVICGENIVYTGDIEGIQDLITPNTKIIKVPKDMLVIPGFMDGHSHAGGYMALKDMMCAISEDAANSGPDRIVKEMSQYVSANPDRPYFLGHNWVDSLFENNCPTAALLDVIKTDKPIVMLDNGGHSYWVNSAMIKLANVTKDTPDPIGGKIERYPDGTPNGCFRDTAIGIIQKALPSLPIDTRISGILAGQEIYKDLGYTALFEALTNEQNKSLEYPNITAYQMLEEQDKLDFYTQGSFVVNNDDTALELVLTGLSLVKKTAGGKFEVNAIKIFMDGVVEGGTAYLSKPYSHDPSTCGAPRWKTEEDLDRLAKIIEIANFAGVPCHIHAIGDQAVSDALDAFQKVYDKIGEKELEARNAITHLMVVKDEDIPRFKQLGVLAVINPWASKVPNYYNEIEVVHLGEERASKEYPYKRFIDAGVKVSFATDFGCSFTVDPIECFHVLTTRTYKDDDPAKALNPEDSLSRFDALKAMTANVAYQMNVDFFMGTLEIGKIANLCILSQDILTIPDNQLMRTRVVASMSYGKWIKGVNQYIY